MHSPSSPRTLAGLALWFVLVAHLPAAIHVHHYYRLGDNDAGVSAGQPVLASADVVGNMPLFTIFGATFYTSDRPTQPAGNALAVSFDGATGMSAPDVVLSVTTSNFGVECWVKPATSTGEQCLVYNGNPGFSGYGIYQVGDTFVALYGGIILFGSAPVQTGVWTHLALVREGNRSTFYANGVACGSEEPTGPDRPTGEPMTIGVNRVGASSQFFTGAIDEVRFFTFAEGQFATSDLLANPPHLSVLGADLVPLANGSTLAFGTAPCGGEVDRICHLRNLAGGVLTIAQLSVSGPAAADYAIALAPVSPVPGGGTSFTVRYRPTAPGARAATLTLVTNDPQEGIFQIALSGSGVTGLANWRQFHFGSPLNAGNGADAFDFDRDGLPNLVEYAFAQSPLRAASAQVPLPAVVAGKYGYRFTEPGGVTGVVYGAEWTTTLQAGDWHPLADAGTGPMHVFEIPIAGTPKIFLRLVVSVP